MNLIRFQYTAAAYAGVLLEDCEGDPQYARAKAIVCAEVAPTTEEHRYWMAVADAIPVPGRYDA